MEGEIYFKGFEILDRHETVLKSEKKIANEDNIEVAKHEQGRCRLSDSQTREDNKKYWEGW